MITSSTDLYAVFGDPVEHSLGPVMHNAAFESINYNGVYLAFRAREIEPAVAAIRTLEIKGASITIPHKIEIMNYLDDVDPAAKKIGAVNTVTYKNGKLTGHNSDGLGAVKALKEQTNVKGRSIAVLGAGGAARAIGFEAHHEGGRVTIINRTIEKGEKLARDIGADFCPLSEIMGHSFEILINSTSLGMAPDTRKMAVKKEYLDPGMVVMDIIYNPLHTALLKAADDIGCTVVNGVSMFVYQGAVQFELWTGQKAPIELMRRNVIRILEKREIGS